MSAMTPIRFDMATGPTETEAVRGCNLEYARLSTLTAKPRFPETCHEINAVVIERLASRLDIRTTYSQSVPCWRWRARRRFTRQ